MAATVGREEIDAAHERLEAADTRPDGAADDAPGGDAQDGLFDRVIEDEQLAALLDERAERGAAKKVATAKFNVKNDAAKSRIEELDLEDGSTVRIGRHRVRVVRTEVREVSFETGGTRRMYFSELDGA